MEIIFLGTGTSQGIPVIGCECKTCTSDDIKNIRLRPSVLIKEDNRNILIDASNDFRIQMLKHNIRRLDGVLLTHFHFDHISGIDDMRMFNNIQRSEIQFYANRITADEVKITFRYAFKPDTPKGGGLPQLSINIINDKPFNVGDLHIIPLKVYHGSLEILGYRTGNFAYITDASYIPEETFALLEGLEVLVLNALRYKIHPTHFNLDQSIAAAKKINAKRTFFTHICHDLEHNHVNSLLPELIQLSYDGLILRIQ